MVGMVIGNGKPMAGETVGTYMSVTNVIHNLRERPSIALIVGQRWI